MKRILVALDASPRATDVLAAATSIARRTGAQLVLLRAVGIPAEIPREAYTMSPGDLAEQLRVIARKGLEAIAHDLPAELVAGLAVVTGTPWQAICAAAEAEDADLVVIG